MDQSQNGTVAAFGGRAPAVDTDDATDGRRWRTLKDVLIVVFGSVMVLSFFLYAITRLGTVKEESLTTSGPSHAQYIRAEGHLKRGMMLYDTRHEVLGKVMRIDEHKFEDGGTRAGVELQFAPGLRKWISEREAGRLFMVKEE